jgi:hypothetical protein
MWEGSSGRFQIEAGVYHRQVKEKLIQRLAAGNLKKFEDFCGNADLTTDRKGEVMVSKAGSGAKKPGKCTKQAFPPVDCSDIMTPYIYQPPASDSGSESGGSRPPSPVASRQGKK